jgi:hypothetical protein
MDQNENVVESTFQPPENSTLGQYSESPGIQKFDPIPEYSSGNVIPEYSSGNVIPESVESTEGVKEFDTIPLIITLKKEFVEWYSLADGVQSRDFCNGDSIDMLPGRMYTIRISQKVSYDDHNYVKLLGHMREKIDVRNIVKGVVKIIPLTKTRLTNYQEIGELL